MQSSLSSRLLSRQRTTRQYYFRQVLLCCYCCCSVLPTNILAWVPGTVSSNTRNFHSVSKNTNTNTKTNHHTLLATSRTLSLQMSSSSNPTTTTTTMRTIPGRSPPFRIQETLDPCVVLMKDLVGQYSDLWNDKGGIFSLAQGVVYWNPPDSCGASVAKAIQENETHLLHTYGPAQGIPELLQALQTKLSTENGFRNEPNIMVTVGANQAYVNCVLTLLKGESQAVVFEPYYFNHVMALQMSCNGDSSVVVGPSRQNNNGVPDVEWLEATLRENSNIDMVTVVNPGNPTGVSLSREELESVVDVCREYNVWLILDCTYEYFTTPSGHQPLVTFPDEEHAIHIFSFSKSYAMAGYRCGYLVMHPSQTQVWQNMLKVQDTLPIGPPRISQWAALGALVAGSEWVHQKYETLDASRQVMKQVLESCLSETMGGTGAMYLMGRLPEGRADLGGMTVEDEVLDVAVARRLVKDFGVAVIPGSFCGFPGWIRVCYANLPPEKCAVAAERLQDGLTSIFLE